MTTLTGQKRQGRIILLILLASIIIDKWVVAPLLPDASALIGINPMPVFLDIPVDLSLTFGLLSVPVLFILLYSSLLLPHSKLNGPVRQRASPRLWPILTALLAIPLCTFIGGLLYSLAHDQLPKHIRNAIESFGINLDIYTIFPGHELIHLRGSMIMLVCFFIGLRICILRIRKVDRNTRPQPDREKMHSRDALPARHEFPTRSQLPARPQMPVRREETISYLGTCVHEGAVVPRQQPDFISEIPQPIRLR
jgi:hypothetical protein